MATAISSLPNEVSTNEVVSRVEKNTEAAVNMKISNPPKQQPIMAPNSPTELSQESIQQIVAGLQQAQGLLVYQIVICLLIIIILHKMNKFNLIMFLNRKIQIILKMTKTLKL